MRELDLFKLETLAFYFLIERRHQNFEKEELPNVLYEDIKNFLEEYSFTASERDIQKAIEYCLETLEKEIKEFYEREKANYPEITLDVLRKIEEDFWEYFRKKYYHLHTVIQLKTEEERELFSSKMRKIEKELEKEAENIEEIEEIGIDEIDDYRRIGYFYIILKAEKITGMYHFPFSLREVFSRKIKPLLNKVISKYGFSWQVDDSPKIIDYDEFTKAKFYDKKRYTIAIS